MCNRVACACSVLAPGPGACIAAALAPTNLDLLVLPNQAVVSALPVKPMLLREPCPDLLLERFTPGPCGEAPRVYPADLARECREVSVEGGVCL